MMVLFDLVFSFSLQLLVVADLFVFFCSMSRSNISFLCFPLVRFPFIFSLVQSWVNSHVLGHVLSVAYLGFGKGGMASAWSASL